MAKKTTPPFLDSASAEKEEVICPHIAFEDDPDTAVAYPSVFNCCYHAKPVMPVNLSVQRKYCLSGMHQQCPVYQRVEPAALPKSFRGQQTKLTARKGWVSLAALAGVALIGLAILLLTGMIKIPGLAVYSGTQTFPFPLSTSTQTLAAVPTETLPSTVTPQPTPTETPISITIAVPRGLETPIGTTPPLIIHSLKEGEGYLMVAGIYETSEEAIKAINYNLPTTALWVGTILVIPISTEDVTGLPKFSTYEVDMEGLTIEDLATRLNVDAVMLKNYNDYPEGYVLSRGEWLIIPHE